MDLLSYASFAIGSNQFELEIPHKKINILRGNLTSELLCIVDYMLFEDYSSLFDSKVITRAELNWGTGSVTASSVNIDLEGSAFQVHCITHAGTESSINSFLIDSIEGKVRLDYNMCKYSSNFSYATWYKIITLVNFILDFEFVSLSNDTLCFNYDSNLDKLFLQSIYLLVSECFLTPLDYSRLLLLSDIAGLDISIKVRLLNTLSSIDTRGMILCNYSLDSDSFECLNDAVILTI